MTDEKIESLAPDLNRDFPRSPREKLGGYVIAARTLDKCRAKLADRIGEYHFDCPLDRRFFDFTEIDPQAFKDEVATGASDEEMDRWVAKASQMEERSDIIQWNNIMRSVRLCDMMDDEQEFLEDYMAENLPGNRPVYVWFDIYDIEEGRL